MLLVGYHINQNLSNSHRELKIFNLNSNRCNFTASKFDEVIGRFKINRRIKTMGAYRKLIKNWGGDTSREHPNTTNILFLLLYFFNFIILGDTRAQFPPAPSGAHDQNTKLSLESLSRKIIQQRKEFAFIPNENI